MSKDIKHVHGNIKKVNSFFYSFTLPAVKPLTRYFSK